MEFSGKNAYVEALQFKNPSLLPLMPGSPRVSTLERWHKEGLPEDVNHLEYIVDELGIPRKAILNFTSPQVNVAIYPPFETKILKHENNHLLVQDANGASVLIADKFPVEYVNCGMDFVTRSWITEPVTCREDFEKMKEHFRADTPGRYAENWAEKVRSAKNDSVVSMSINGPFWQMRNWVGFEELCMLMLEDPDFVEEMAQFWTDFMSDMLKAILKNVQVDRICISEDMAYKAHPMISPEMTRRFLVPSYKAWIPIMREYGVPIVGMDSDGYINDLIPIWIENGFDYAEPLEVAAYNDICLYRKIYGKNIGFTGGIDKRLMAEGGKALEQEILRIAPVVEGGGYIPGCDHGVPPDISFANYQETVRMIAKLSGWL